VVADRFARRLRCARDATVPRRRCTAPRIVRTDRGAIRWVPRQASRPTSNRLPREVTQPNVFRGFGRHECTRLTSGGSRRSVRVGHIAACTVSWHWASMTRPVRAVSDRCRAEPTEAAMVAPAKERRLGRQGEGCATRHALILTRNGSDEPIRGGSFPAGSGHGWDRARWSRLRCLILVVRGPTGVNPNGFAFVDVRV
jgi:hypothetical protein